MIAPRPGPSIVIRRARVFPRLRADTFVVVTEPRATAAALRGVLYAAQRERGRGDWSDADPLVLVDGLVVGRVRTVDGIDEVVRDVLERVLACAAPIRHGRSS